MAIDLVISFHHRRSDTDCRLRCMLQISSMTLDRLLSQTGEDNFINIIPISCHVAEN